MLWGALLIILIQNGVIDYRTAYIIIATVLVSVIAVKYGCSK